MSDLANKKCVPCEGGVVPFDISEIHKYQKKVKTQKTKVLPDFRKVSLEPYKKIGGQYQPMRLEKSISRMGLRSPYVGRLTLS